MKTLLTKYGLYLYGSYYLETKPRLLCTGTTNKERKRDNNKT